MDERYATSPVRLSVVICTKDRPKELATCLESITRQRRLPMEVVVVDSSAMPPEAVVDDFRGLVTPACAVTLIHTQPGLPRQRNVGIRAARGDVVVFFDDDVILEPEYLEELALVYERDAACAIGGVGGAQVPDPTPRESVARRAWSQRVAESHAADGVARQQPHRRGDRPDGSAPLGSEGRGHDRNQSFTGTGLICATRLRVSVRHLR